jgi:hypothetical protein
MGVLSALGNDLLGNPKKAFLIIHKDTGKALDSVSIAKKTESALAVATAGDTVGLTAAALKASMLTQGIMDFHILRVQYNPSSLTISANATSMDMKSLQQGNIEDSMIVQNSRPPSVVLGVQLIFDAVNNKDAFMFEKFRLSPTDIAADIAGAILGREYTVQPQTNALLAMVMRDSTRVVTFKWAEMTFTGEVTEISARYTMFSVSGKPIRSVVNLRLTQLVESTADSKYWDTAFDNCFGGAYTPKDSGGKRATDTFGNLINLGL